MLTCKSDVLSLTSQNKATLIRVGTVTIKRADTLILNKNSPDGCHKNQLSHQELFVQQAAWKPPGWKLSTWEVLCTCEHLVKVHLCSLMTIAVSVPCTHAASWLSCTTLLSEISISALEAAK